MMNNKRIKIWIDLDNSPHIPFFKPIIEELEKRNYTVMLTARDCFQVCGLADRAKLKYKCIGGHYGKHTVLKIVGLLVRAMQMLPMMLRERPTIAVSHGSRTQQLLATLLRIPNIMIFDYEHASALLLLQPDHVIVPDIIADSAVKFSKSRLHKYPGIKEDVYVPDFKPDNKIEEMLGINSDDIIATIRPPASEAHYRNPESELLFTATVETLALDKNVRMIMLPRNEKQAEVIRARWPELFSHGKIIIPKDVVDGLNLMWFSDIVVSGGGTMNREAAALGVPVYSIFRGKTGAVDKYLSEKSRLTFLETVEDVRTKIRPIKRAKEMKHNMESRATFQRILTIIEEIAQNS